MIHNPKDEVFENGHDYPGLIDSGPRPQVFVANIYTKHHLFARAKFFKILEKEA